MRCSTGFRQHLKSTFTAIARDERDEAVALLQEVRVAVLAFHNRVGILLVNSASSFKASGVSPLLPPTSVQHHGRVVAIGCAPGPGARERTVATRRRRRRRARPPRRRRRRRRGGGRGPGADDQLSGRRTFPSVLNARSPGMKPPRNSRLFRVSRGHVAAPSVPGTR